MDPEIYLFGYLIDRDLIDYESNAFMLLISHLFMVVPSLRDECTLPDLPNRLSVSLTAINRHYIKHSSKFVNPILASLQSNSKDILMNINGFLHCFTFKKNSYILDFFNHGDENRLCNFNGIEKSEIWNRLYNIDLLIKNVILMIEKYFGSDDIRLKPLKLTYEKFNKRFKSIFA